MLNRLHDLCADHEFAPVAERFAATHTPMTAGSQLRLGVQLLLNALRELPTACHAEVIEVIGAVLLGEPPEPAQQPFPPNVSPVMH